MPARLAMKEEFDFDTEVYTVVGEIPEGKVLSYGDIARLIGKPQHSRRVGRSMSRVPAALNLPCHRVVKSSGETVPGWTGQRLLLENEGVCFRSNACVDMQVCRWDFYKEL